MKRVSLRHPVYKWNGLPWQLSFQWLPPYSEYVIMSPVLLALFKCLWFLSLVRFARLSHDNISKMFYSFMSQHDFTLLLVSANFLFIFLSLFLAFYLSHAIFLRCYSYILCFCPSFNKFRILNILKKRPLGILSRLDRSGPCGRYIFIRRKAAIQYLHVRTIKGSCVQFTVHFWILISLGWRMAFVMNRAKKML